ncbi:hypothetical protein D3C80_2115260 [compost metagenome]
MGGRSQCVKHRFVQVTVSDTGTDDALITFGNQCLSRRIGGVGIIIDNADFGQLSQTGDVKRRIRGVLALR